jgi:hypothetical protein
LDYVYKKKNIYTYIVSGHELWYIMVYYEINVRYM